VSLRFAILGYLSTAPGTGYDLARQFDAGLGWFWSARHSQIYPELKRLADEGLVRRDAATISDNFDKYVYSLTEAGAAALAEWVKGPASYPPNRDGERLRLIFCDDAPEALRDHLEAHREHHQRRRRRLQEVLDSIRAGAHQRINERLASRPPEKAALTLKLRELAYSGDIARADLEIEWAEQALAWLDSAGESSAGLTRSEASQERG
jgi:PadR family transcriptional regulator, regulatory protein AphA